MFMVGHRFLKLYVTVVHMKLFREHEERGFKARGQVGFRSTHQTINHIFTLRALIDEALYCFLKVYYCFVNF